jgi:hypothetical protein
LQPLLLLGCWPWGLYYTIQNPSGVIGFRELLPEAGFDVA